MWFNGMGEIQSWEYIQKAKEEIEKAIQSCERDYGSFAEDRIEKLKSALVLL